MEKKETQPEQSEVPRALADACYHNFFFTNKDIDSMKSNTPVIGHFDESHFNSETFEQVDAAFFVDWG